MKTRAQSQLDNGQQIVDEAELHRLKALFQKRPVIRKVRISKKKPVTRHNKKVDEFDMQKILVMRDEHKYTYDQIGRKLNFSGTTVLLALRRYKSRQNEHIDNRRYNGKSTPRKITPAI